MHGVSKMFKEEFIESIEEKRKYDEKWKHLSEEIRQNLRRVHPIALVVRIIKFYRKRIVETLKESGVDVNDKYVSLLIDKILYAIVSDPELISEAVLKKVLRRMLENG